MTDILRALVSTKAPRKAYPERHKRNSIAFKRPNYENHQMLYFRFGNRTHESKGTMEVRIPVTKDAYIPVVADIVDVYVPFLSRLNALRKCKK